MECMCRLRNIAMRNYHWESVTTGQTDRHGQTDAWHSDPCMCRYAPQGTQYADYELFFLFYQMSLSTFILRENWPYPLLSMSGRTATKITGAHLGHPVINIEVTGVFKWTHVALKPQPRSLKGKNVSFLPSLSPASRHSHLLKMFIYSG